MLGSDPAIVPTGATPRGALGEAVRILRSGLAAAADLILPPVCLSCRERLAAHDALCPACWQGIDFIRPPLCNRLGLPMPFDVGGIMVSAAAVARPPPYDRARAVARYAGVMRALAHALKFRDRHDTRRLFGRWLVEAGADLVKDADVVVPVPLGRWRVLMRHFNQAAILAREIGRLTGVAYEPMVLQRIRPTRSQVGLTPLQRKENVAGAFAVPPSRRKSVVGRSILLVDDVITTGATVGSCAQALKRAGAERVDVLALALVTDVVLLPV